jgi:hypothetical protein
LVKKKLPYRGHFAELQILERGECLIFDIKHYGACKSVAARYNRILKPYRFKSGKYKENEVEYAIVQRVI